jgi:hypothetical protein
VKKLRFCGFFSGGEIQRSFRWVAGGTIVIAATTVNIASVGIALALRPLFSGKKIMVEWMFIALWTAIAIRPSDLASTALSASSGRRTDAGSGTAS